MKAKAEPSEARFAYEGLDRVIHERARLSRHLSVLERAKMVEINKSIEGNRPLTVCKITASGRKRYIEYLATLEQVVKDAAKVTKEIAAPGSIARLAPSRV